MFGLQAEYIVQNQLGGAMVWSLEGDDFSGITGTTFPLVKTIKRNM
jgi:GH18 family chitinase